MQRELNRIDEIGASIELNRMLLLYAPDERARNIVAEAYTQLMLDFDEPKDRVRILAGELHDGLTHGNWPWVSFTVDDLTGDK
jgi:hypothetical protein